MKLPTAPGASPPEAPRGRGHRPGVLDRRPRSVVGGADVAPHREVLEPDRRNADVGPPALGGLLRLRPSGVGWGVGSGAGVGEGTRGGRDCGSLEGRVADPEVGSERGPPNRSWSRSSPSSAGSDAHPVRSSPAAATSVAAVRLRRGLTRSTVRQAPETGRDTRTVSPGRTVPASTTRAFSPAAASPARSGR